MIRSFREKKTLRFAEGERVPAFEGFRHPAEKRLRVLEAATSLRDLAQLPSNRLETLSGDRERSVQHPDQSAVAYLLYLAGRSRRP